MGHVYHNEALAVCTGMNCVMSSSVIAIGTESPDLCAHHGDAGANVTSI